MKTYAVRKRNQWKFRLTLKVWVIHFSLELEQPP